MISCLFIVDNKYTVQLGSSSGVEVSYLDL